MAGDIVEVRVVADERPRADAKEPPAPPPADVPKNAKVVLSIESLVDADGNIHAKCVIGGKTVSLKGHATAMRDGKRKVSVDFSQQDGADVEQVSSSIELARG